MMSYRIEISQIGDHGTCEGPRTTFIADSVDEAITRGKSELENRPRSPRPVMFRIHDQTKRMILSYTLAVRPRLL